MRNLLALLAVLFLVTTLACAPASEEAATDEEATADPAAEEVAEAEEGGDEDGEHSADDERDEWSKPFQVYEFVGIEEGDVVLDLLAGGGYNTVRVAEVVGPEGKVVAERVRPEFKRQVEEGEIDTAAPVQFAAFDELEPNSVDAILAIRAYHIWEDVAEPLGVLYETLRPGGVVGVVEIRLNEESGHDMETHRLGEQTAISDWEGAGFEFVDSSDMLRVEGDDYSVFVPEGKQRYQLDRMLLKFRKPEE